MAFKDILNKGIDFIQSGAKAVKDAALEKKSAMEEFDILKTRSQRIGPMQPFVVRNNDPQDGKEQMILSSCLTLSVENAKVINKALPIEQTPLGVRTSKEAQTEIEYLLVATDKAVWVLNKKEYMTIEFNSIKECGIVNKGIMSQGVKFDDKAFIIDGNETDVTDFFRIIKDENYRYDLIKWRTAYLAGIVPVKQLLNMNLKGISIGEENAVVLHNGSENKRLNVHDIEGAQVLLNDTVAVSKGRHANSNFMSSPMEARKMSVRVILTAGEFVIETLPQNTMNIIYKREDSTYIKNYDFAKSIVDTIANLIDRDIVSGSGLGTDRGSNDNQNGEVVQAKSADGIPDLDIFHIEHENE